MASSDIYLDGLKRGDTYEFDAVITRTASGVTLPYDLTGAAVELTIGAGLTGAAIITKSIGNGITVTDAPAGKIHAKLDPADTANIVAPVLYRWRIVATKAPDQWTAIIGMIGIVNG